VAEQGLHGDKNEGNRGERRSGERREDESFDSENDALRARLNKLTEALDSQMSGARQSADTGAGRSSGAIGSVMSLAFRLMSEFVAAVIVGTAIGWGIDHLAGTSPLFLVVFLFMGAAAGFWNVYRISTEKPRPGNRSDDC
jgi:ATP synthase protein I